MRAQRSATTKRLDAVVVQASNVLRDEATPVFVWSASTWRSAEFRTKSVRESEIFLALHIFLAAKKNHAYTCPQTRADRDRPSRPDAFIEMNADFLASPHRTSSCGLFVDEGQVVRTLLLQSHRRPAKRETLHSMACFHSLHTTTRDTK